MNTPVLEIEHYTKSYDGKRNAVEDLTLTVREGDIYELYRAERRGQDDDAARLRGRARFQKRRHPHLRGAPSEGSPCSASR